MTAIGWGYPSLELIGGLVDASLGARFVLLATRRSVPPRSAPMSIRPNSDQAGRAPRWRLLEARSPDVDIIAGASLVRRTVNLPLSIVKSGSGYRTGLSSPKFTALQAPRCPKCSASGDTDSPVEGDGLELSVPRERGHRFELSLLFMSLKPSAF
jgi:hypothetical protein